LIVRVGGFLTVVITINVNKLVITEAITRLNFVRISFCRAFLWAAHSKLATERRSIHCFLVSLIIFTTTMLFV